MKHGIGESGRVEMVDQSGPVVTRPRAAPCVKHYLAKFSRVSMRLAF